MTRLIDGLLVVLAICMVAVLWHYGYSVSMTADGQYFVQGYIGTAVPVFAGLCLLVIGAALRS